MAGEVCSSTHCARWASDYLGYCLCSTKDGVSLVLGLLSVISWGIAEIPQIITNYKSKSTEGLSFAFLLTWIIGDLLNMFGCLMEPATLPTQFYMALLYTVTTLILTLQTIYYGLIYPRYKANKQFHKGGTTNQTERVGAHSEDSENGGEFVNKYGQHRSNSDIFQTGTATSSPIPFRAALPPSYSSEQDSYYRSARSLSTSHTPTKSSIIAPWRAHRSVDARHSVQEPLLSGSLPTVPMHPSPTKNLLCVVSALTFILATMNIHSSNNSRLGVVLERSSDTAPGYVHRKLMQVNGQQQITSESGGLGTYMGWGMTAIYVGGRFPQIFLNMRRGNVEGLNPLMFIFALFGNTTYVASILVNSMDWLKIRPNLPWLVDAVGCAVLDTFIILQFTYFAYWRFKLPVSMYGNSHLR